MVWVTMVCVWLPSREESLWQAVGTAGKQFVLCCYHIYKGWTLFFQCDLQEYKLSNRN